MMVDAPMEGWWSWREPLRARYDALHGPLASLASAFVSEFDRLFAEAGVRATSKGRVKAFDAFYRKLLERRREVGDDDPFTVLTDLLGLRVVTPFLEDLQRIEALLRERYLVEEVDDKASALADHEFGYDSTHLLLVVPDRLLEAHGRPKIRVAEVQIRTTLQDAWADVEHELVYKADLDVVDAAVRRKLSALNATLSLADTIFQEVRDFQRRRYADLQHRNQRALAGLAWKEPLRGAGETFQVTPTPNGSGPADVLEPDGPDAALSSGLVRALQAHADGRHDEAIALYSEVLAVRPTYAVYNHRGLALAAVGDYERAIADFTTAIEMAPEQARAFTHRGVALRMAGRPDEALRDLDRALEIQPTWADALYARALVRYDLGDVPEALRDCDRALAVRSHFEQVLRFKQYLQGLG